MDPQWRTERLPELVRALASRPRHEALRGHMTELLRSGFDAPYDEIAHEVYLLDGSGRIDTLWGATVIELKSDLRRELPDVLARLPDYLADAAARSRSPRPVTGLATDGATFIAYALREGALAELARYATDPARPDELVAWLELLLTDRPDLLPEPRAVVQAFGRASLTFGRARLQLNALWAALHDDPEVRLKRDLWDGLLREAYGEPVGEDALFLQHTYLTMVVKAVAARVLDLPVDDPAALLSGRALQDAGILGAVEADFFDWPLRLPAGASRSGTATRAHAAFDGASRTPRPPSPPAARAAMQPAPSRSPAPAAQTAPLPHARPTQPRPVHPLSTKAGSAINTLKGVGLRGINLVIVQEVLVAARHRGDREQRTADQATLYWTAAAGANAGVAADATGAG